MEIYAAEKLPGGNHTEPKTILFISDPYMLPFSEYYLAEYRMGEIDMFDRTIIYKDIPGLVIWHIDTYVHTTDGYKKPTSFIKPVYKSGTTGYDKKDIYVAGDVFSSNSIPVNNDFYDDIYTGIYLEVLDLDEEKVTVKGGFRDPDLTPVPVVAISAPSKRRLKVGMGQWLMRWRHIYKRNCYRQNIYNFPLAHIRRILREQ